MQDDKSFGVMMSSRREVLCALSTPLRCTAPCRREAQAMYFAIM